MVSQHCLHCTPIQVLVVILWLNDSLGESEGRLHHLVEYSNNIVLYVHTQNMYLMNMRKSQQVTRVVAICSACIFV